MDSSEPVPPAELDQMSAGTEPRQNPPWARLERPATGLLLAATFAATLAWSWQKWPDVGIDFGRELYVPWQLCEGEVLYRDIAYFNGPLSAYWNALWFTVFGVSLRTLVLVNVVLLAAIVVLLYRMIATIADRGAATLASLTFLLVFACGHYDWCGNFNWICPYSHEVTHGIGLSLLAIYLLGRHQVSRHWLSAALAGLVVGLAFLTKVEIFLAVAMATLLAWGAILRLAAPTWRAILNLLIFTVAAMVAPAVACGLLSQAIPPREALRATLGGWPYVAIMVDLPYHRVLRGVDGLGGNLRALLLATGAYLLGLGLVIWLSLVMRRRGESNAWPAAAVFLVTLLVAGSLASSIDDELLRPWPIFTLLIAVGAGIEIGKARQPSAEHDRLVLRLAMAAFSLGLLARILLRTRVVHYGFGLAMPATLLLVAAAWTWIPARITAWKGDARVYRAALLAFWLAAVGQFVVRSDHYYRAKTYPIGDGGDQFLADDRAPYLKAAADRVAQKARPGDTLVVAPEGVMLNYLLRMPNPTPYTNFIPPEMLMFREERMLSALKTDPPQWIILTQRDTAEFGARAFGHDYGQQIVAWIEEHYQAEAVFESPPPIYAVLVVRRKAAAESP